MIKKLREMRIDRDLRRLQKAGYVYCYHVDGKPNWALTKKGQRELRGQE